MKDSDQAFKSGSRLELAITLEDGARLCPQDQPQHATLEPLARADQRPGRDELQRVGLRPYPRSTATVSNRARFALKDFDATRIDVVVTSRKSAEELIPTRASLLARIKDPDDATSWQEFHDTYRRLIFGVARKAGLSGVEAEDATQDTLVAVAQNIGEFRYEPKRCSFKTWLMMITRQRIIWQIRKRQRVGGSQPFSSEGAGHPAARRMPALRDDDTARTATVERVPDPESLNLDVLWDEEWRQNLLAAALERVKAQVNPRQFQIFELAAIQAWPVSDIVRTLRVSAAQVYLARHRVGAALKREVRKLETEL